MTKNVMSSLMTNHNVLIMTNINIVTRCNVLTDYMY